MRQIAVGLVALLVITGCDKENDQVEADRQQEVTVAAEAQDLRGTFDYMVDSALLADMTLSDYHFLPDRAALSPTGEQRLIRLAALLDAHGGHVRLNTVVTDEELVDRRVETVHDFLAAHGIDTTSEIIRMELPGSRGMEAREAIIIKQAATAGTAGAGAATQP